ncbi:Sensor histidine kinase YehU [Blautia producta]|uniref:Sensor histidine kinase YehU n=1 Tax=Blautia producta TaxID=33035 RepID=A0A4P6LYM2_9FIRM|nr:sensor histidine kinase [Blautia producta]QBE97256.1 Sensor histidine kinase YehU [Blautia producta]
MKKSKKFYGIRKKLVIFTILAAILPLGIMGVVLAGSINRNVTDLNLENYSHSNSKMIGNYQMMVLGFDELTRNYITNSYIQKSLERKELLPQDKAYVNRSLWYANNQYTEYGIFIDNKGNEYFSNKVITGINPEDILSEELSEALADNYSLTQIMYSTIDLNGQDDSGVFLVRNIRHMEQNVEPGILIIKLNQEFYDNIFFDVNQSSPAVYAMVTLEGEICCRTGGSGQEEVISKNILQQAKENLPNEAGEVSHFAADNQICFVNTDKNQDFIFISVVPESVIQAPARNFLKGLGLTMLISTIVCVVMSVFVSHPFRKAISGISRIMSNFDGKSLDREIQISTNTELDWVAVSYNKMLKHIGSLMEEVKKEQEEIRINEYNSLVYQINPHFLYNTLDNIHMLARMDKDETMVRIIQSLSSMLRISISKGENDIPLRNELEHVRCYLNIEQIRNEDLFEYRIEAEEAVQQVLIPKIILQPVVENCIKYGFADLDEGGIIKVDVKSEADFLIMRVTNNGSVIDPAILEKLNQMQYQGMEQIKQTFPQKKGGYGISNVVCRLCLRYGDRFRICYESSEEKGTVCTIKLQIEENSVVRCEHVCEN